MRSGANVSQGNARGRWKCKTSIRAETIQPIKTLSIYGIFVLELRVLVLNFLEKKKVTHNEFSALGKIQLNTKTNKKKKHTSMKYYFIFYLNVAKMANLILNGKPFEYL